MPLAPKSHGIRVYSTKTGEKGFSRLFRKFHQYNETVEKKSDIITRKVAKQIRRDTKANIRNSLTQQTGALARSAYFRKGYGNEPSYEVGVSAEYAMYPEFGTGIYNILGEGRNSLWLYRHPFDGRFYRTEGQQAHLFFNDAVEKNLGQYPDKLRKGIGGSF